MSIHGFKTAAASVAVGTAVEAMFQPAGYLPAGTYAKADYPALAAVMGDNPINYSPDALLPQNLAGTNTNPYPNVAGGDGYLLDMQTDGTLFVYTNGYFIFVSANGLDWKPVYRIDAALERVTKLKYRNGVWFGYRHGLSTPSNSGYITSTDGVNWSFVATGFSFCDMTWDGTNYLFVSGTVSRFGPSLAALTLGTLGAAATCCEKIGAAWLAWGNSTATSLYKSSNGTIWAMQSTGQTQSYGYSVTNGQLFIMRYEDATSRPWYVATADGAIWTACGSSGGDAALRAANTAVIWDGTTYSFGTHYAGASTGYIYAGTTVGGAFTGYNNTGSNASLYTGNLIAYKAGAYVGVGGYYGREVYVWTTTPSANWNYQDAFSGVGCRSFWPAGEYGTLATSEFQRAMLYVHNCYAGGITAYLRALFVEDGAGYFVQYSWSTGNTYFTYTVQNSEYMGMGACIYNGGNAVVVRVSGTRYIYYSINHATRKLDNISSFTGTNTYTMFSTRDTVIAHYAASGYVFYGSTYLILNSMPGYGTDFASFYASAYCSVNNIAILSGAVSTTATAKISYDGGYSWVSYGNIVLIGEDGIADTFTGQFTMWHDGEMFNLVCGGLLYRGVSPTMLRADAKRKYFTEQASSCAHFHSCSQDVQLTPCSIAAHGGNVPYASPGLLGRVVPVLHKFDWGSIVHSIPGVSGAPLSGAYSRHESDSTHFKVPVIAPVDARLHVFYKAE